MASDRIQHVIAERQLHLIDDPSRDVRVLIGQPSSDGYDSKCAYQTVGISDEQIRHVTGIDGIQALELLVTRTLPAWLNRLLEEHPGLRWLDAPPCDFGFTRLP